MVLILVSNVISHHTDFLLLLLLARLALTSLVASKLKAISLLLLNIN